MASSPPKERGGDGVTRNPAPSLDWTPEECSGFSLRVSRITPFTANHPGTRDVTGRTTGSRALTPWRAERKSVCAPAFSVARGRLATSPLNSRPAARRVGLGMTTPRAGGRKDTELLLLRQAAE